MALDRDMNIVMVGHVDHGKSTIIGRLLADTDSLPTGKLEDVKERCRRNSKPFEYSFLLDALKDEQAQGITIDSARCFFKTDKRRYIIVDAPGHVEFIKNMVTGAARAEAAVLVIDAAEGVKENSKRHGYLLSMLGIKQVVVAVNKIDLVDYDQATFDRIKEEYTEFLKGVGVTPDTFVPISGFNGDNLTTLSNNTPWYGSETLLEVLDRLKNKNLPVDERFRMFTQDIYKFTGDGDDRRIVSGTIDTGEVKVGDEVVFYPSQKGSKVKTIEYFNGEVKEEDSAGFATGFTLEEQIYITRGELATVKGEKEPFVTDRIQGKLFWLGKDNLEEGKNYVLKVGTRRVIAKLESVDEVMDAATMEKEDRTFVRKHEVALCTFSLDKEIAFDLDLDETSRFILVDDYEISGGGIISKALEDNKKWLRDKVKEKQAKWVDGAVTLQERTARTAQRPILLLLTGKFGPEKKEVAKYIERRLFNLGRDVYYLGIENLLYGLDADIEKTEDINEGREEHFRRLGELSNIMLDTGKIFVVTAGEVNSKDTSILKTVMGENRFKVVWLGDLGEDEGAIDLHVNSLEYGDVYEKVEELLQKEKIIFNPWYYTI